ncbi:hypothetical protein CDQ84_01470 [Clostridium thermosuccinogenes]|jgi:hypothetical protein|uniref:FeoB-associated Cys-rich membrane protein n=1 Tax=Clostridium thermosuccinogenes TaxID=84032 RepID=A0A2K2F466_9CLOT|nr:FeoB-associated Cys-rich membrane protein [Pseudoclostridium thermosuccinogenes]AUS95722.1 hypothetical protein CDO33_04265 [Pseudoclostridium thermosuccinogenes]PNT93556.1 hypothetical protein CDQ83_08670 [Pseudoclostridium thermosuccinogenes]PNT99918.1 hypothetical protein CDQ85_01470 [Pseudoclostridium thermosuccinogenes]PNU01363.1 hypothetical protein CDQ84_01470 [Pseudoclostridium thermosuccinogenes]
MIDWIIGGIIVALTVYIIVRTVIRMRKGENCCSGCSGCSVGEQSRCGCNTKP